MSVPGFGRFSDHQRKRRRSLYRDGFMTARKRRPWRPGQRATFKSNVIGCNGVGSLSNALKGLMRVIGQGLEINFIGNSWQFFSLMTRLIYSVADLSLLPVHRMK